MASDSQSDSQETTSTSLMIEEHLNISFQDLTCVRRRVFSRGRKTVLNGVSGSFIAGQLSVLMGQSGAGKTTLMNILAGYTQPTSGNIYVNDHIRNYEMFRRRSCYILQDDMVQDMLTIHESLTIAADLKLGNNISKEMKTRRVEEIILSLGLRKARDTRAGNLSGGQKKRLAIGLELVSDPPVMFLDEPTSGLDSSMSKQIVYLLHLLARQGRTVVATMHQPSATLLTMVDRMYAVVGGRCAYMGSVSMLVPYLKELNLICPNHYNRVDYLIEICAEYADKLVNHSGNGKNTQWNVIPAEETKNRLDEISRQSSTCEDVTITVLPTRNEESTNKILLKLKSTYSTSFWKQFETLTRRSLLTTVRNPHLTLMMTGIHCAMATFVGMLMYQIGQEAQNMRDNFSFLFFSLMFLMFTAFSAVTISFPSQFPVVRREHFNRWYMTGAYYASTLISSIPTQILCTVSYAIIAYLMTGQPLDPSRFFRFVWILLLVSFVALNLGFFTGSIFDVKNGVVFGPFFIMPFTIFSGFFLQRKDAPFVFRWMFEISFLKHGLVGVVQSILGMQRPLLPCNAVYCHYRNATVFIKELGVEHCEYHIAVVCLMSIAVVISVCTFTTLKLRLRTK